MLRSMKITTNQYAKSLYEMTAGKSKREIDGVAGNFIKFLIKNRQKKMFPKIIQRFSEIWNNENGVVETEVITSRTNDQGTMNSIEKFIKDKYQAKEVIFKNKVDSNIKGGIIIKIGDEVLDGSIATQLKELKQKLIS